MTVWGAETFCEPVIQQNLEFCDEIVLMVGHHHSAMAKWNDKSLEICQKYSDRYDNVTLVEAPTCVNEPYNKWRAKTLNILLQKSSIFEIGNWIFLIDVDEFMFKKDLDYIRTQITKNYDTIWIYDKFFFLNMKHYTGGCGNYRLWKIKNPARDKFTPTNRWIDGPKTAHYVPAPNVLMIPEENGIFHYSLLCDPYQKLDYWATEYPHQQDYKTEWMKNKYLKATLKNIEELTENSVPRAGKCQYHIGNHPEFIEKFELNKIEDFRTLYHE